MSKVLGLTRVSQERVRLGTISKPRVTAIVRLGTAFGPVRVITRKVVEAWKKIPAPPPQHLLPPARVVATIIGPHVLRYDGSWKELAGPGLPRALPVTWRITDPSRSPVTVRTVGCQGRPLVETDGDALKFAFGADPISGAARVLSPGMPDSGTPLYLGLDPKGTASDPTSTVADIFAFAGLESLGKNLPVQGLALLKTTLKRGDAGERRNALWFSPEEQLKTTMRLEFELDEAKVLEDALTSVLPGLAF